VPFLILFLGLALLLIAIWLWRRTRRRVTRFAVAVPLTVLAVIAIVVGGVLVWYTHRPLPPPVDALPLFQGITYTREVHSEPRPLVIHVVAIDLTAPGIGFLVTPGDPAGDHQLAARTTSHFLQTSGVQVAINGDFYRPWWYNGPWDYYPHDGDPVSVYGAAVSEGVRYSTSDEVWRWSLALTADNRASFETGEAAGYNVISGDVMILVDGQAVDLSANVYHLDPHPRTVVALDRARETLLLFVVDGRQPNYSEGVTSPELAAIALEYGAWDAINLDGGGSSTLAVQGPDGAPRLLNTPIDIAIPGQERPVANHLGVYALPLPGDS